MAKQLEARLTEDRVLIWDKAAGEHLFESEYCGKMREDRLELSLIEAAVLAEAGRIKIVDVSRKKMSFEELVKFAEKLDPRFHYRYTVYRDLRINKDLPTRTGFKFGCDFRVYEKGVKPMKRGPKAAKEHTKWIVFAVPEGFVSSFQELSRAVRLAHNIRANMLWAIVDPKNNVVYYQVTFFKP
jgi:tRNA-intron endonuclease